jgi:hypothetical protein
VSKTGYIWITCYPPTQLGQHRSTPSYACGNPFKCHTCYILQFNSGPTWEGTISTIGNGVRNQLKIYFLNLYHGTYSDSSFSETTSISAVSSLNFGNQTNESACLPNKR